jgi:hypothetical protein
MTTRNVDVEYKIPSRQRLIQQVTMATLGAIAVELCAVFLFEGYPIVRLCMLGAAPVTFIIGNIIFLRLQKNIFRMHSHSWYREAFPGSVRNGSGRILCRHCECPNIGVRNLLEQTYHRAHVCNQCGETLYYSAE